MAETGTFNEELVKKVYEVAGKGEPPVGHLFVRQEFGRLFDGPVTFKDPETPLGTHIFTALKFAPGDTKTQWITISLQGDDSTAVLDRIEIPADLRQKISERLTPGSSLIIGDTAINTATLTKGSDFLVWAKDTPAKITSASIEDDAKSTQPRKKKRTTVRRNNYDYSYRYQRAVLARLSVLALVGGGTLRWKRPPRGAVCFSRPAMVSIVAKSLEGASRRNPQPSQRRLPRSSQEPSQCRLLTTPILQNGVIPNVSKNSLHAV